MAGVFEFLALVVLLSGAVLLVWLALRGLALRSRVKRWPRRQGVVSSAAIRSRRRHHRPQFMVDYAADRGNVTVMCESPTRSGFSEGRNAHAFLARYPVGSEVLLYLDPADPSRAFLWLPELHMIVVFFIAAGILATAAIAGFASAFNLDLVGGPPDFALDAPSSSGGTDTAAEMHASAAGASIHVGFASTPPPGDYRFVRLHENGRAEIREVLTVNGPGPWLTYEGVVSVPPATARAIVLAADPVRFGIAPPPVSGAPCVLGLTSTTAPVWQGCADAALARRVLASVPPLTLAAPGSPCSRPVCDVRLVRSAPAKGHERYGQIAQDIVINSSGAFSCATASPDGRETPHVLRVLSGRVRAADAGALFDWLAAGLHETGPRVPDDGLAAGGVVARSSGGVWTRVATPQATATWMRWARIATRLPPACRLPADGLRSPADVGRR